jgi:8-oxo-dGTP diphosphatase
MNSNSEAAFLTKYDPARFERPSVAVDVVLLTTDHEVLQTLLVRRTVHPDLDKWALPGGFVRIDESLDDAAARVLAEKANLRSVFVEQLYTFGEPLRDPRMRIVSVAYYALVAAEQLHSALKSTGERLATVCVAGPEKSGEPVRCVSEDGHALPIAFDHAAIIGTAVKRLRGKLDYTPVGYALLPEWFTLLQLQRLHEIISGARVNKDSFRRRMLASGELEETGAIQTGVGHRPAVLYRFSQKQLQ